MGGLSRRLRALVENAYCAFYMANFDKPHSYVKRMSTLEMLVSSLGGRGGSSGFHFGGY